MISFKIQQNYRNCNRPRQMVPFKPMFKFQLTNTLIIGTHLKLLPPPPKKKKIKTTKRQISCTKWVHLNSLSPGHGNPNRRYLIHLEAEFSEWLDTSLLGSAVFFTVTAIETCRGEMPGHDDSTGVTAHHDCNQVERVENQHSWHDVLRRSTPIQFELQSFFPSVYF